jgi:DNA ligase 1
MIDLAHGLDADLDDLEQYVGRAVQEKYRGVRLYWDGRAAWSRQGIEVELPDEWYAALPRTQLDAELFDGPQGERRCASAIRFGPKHVTKTMRLIAFDSPASPSAPWVDRMMSVVSAVESADFDRLEYAPWSTIKSLDGMLSALAEVHSREGEGLIIRKADAPYRPGYSDNIVKLKFAA